RMSRSIIPTASRRCSLPRTSGATLPRSSSAAVSGARPASMSPRLSSQACCRRGGWRSFIASACSIAAATRWANHAGPAQIKGDSQRAGLDEVVVLAILDAVRVEQRADVLSKGHDVEARERFLAAVVGEMPEQAGVVAREGLRVFVVQRTQGSVV